MRSIGRHFPPYTVKVIPVCSLVLIALLGGTVTPDGCTNSYVALSPVALLLPPDQVKSAAQYYAELRPGAFVLTGEGNGMMPLYSAGTVIVVDPVPYRTLQEGMTVLFLSPHDGRVAHYLVRESPGGWITVGVNQSRDDDTPMTSDNYIGQVVMAFAPEKATSHPN